MLLGATVAFMAKLSTPQVILILFVLLVISIFLRRRNRVRLLKKVPVVGLNGGKRTLNEARQAFVTECADMMFEGYETTQGGFFYLPSPAGERLMIPTRYIEELKNTPNELVDFTASFSEMFEGKYTTIGQKWHLHPGVVKGPLNAKLDLIMPPVEDEVRHAFRTLLSPSDDWTPVQMAGIFTEIISRASNRMLGGQELSRNAEWTSTSINFTTDTWLAAKRLKQYPRLLRPVIQLFLPEIAKVRKHCEVSQRTIIPIVKSRCRLEDKGPKPVDLLQMLWDSAQGEDKSPEFMAYTCLAISFAAIRTSSSVPTHLLYDLCARPEYIEPLRQEIEQVLAKEGSFTKAAINKLVKLDSFMKESQRFNPLSFLTFGRVVHQDLTLHDGVIIPAGTFIAVPSHAITHDPNFYPSPSSFTGFRFVPDGETPSSFVTTNASNLSWGYGKHACSGRFFAANEIKMVFAYFLINYDFKFSFKRKRPRNVAFELQNQADETVLVMVRRRQIDTS